VSSYGHPINFACSFGRCEQSVWKAALADVSSFAADLSRPLSYPEHEYEDDSDEEGICECLTYVLVLFYLHTRIIHELVCVWWVGMTSVSNVVIWAT
jgi:hypothetical protein